jgi:hypothetical protein
MADMRNQLPSTPEFKKGGHYGRSFFSQRHGLSGFGHGLSAQLHEPQQIHEAYKPLPQKSA